MLPFEAHRSRRWNRAEGWLTEPYIRKLTLSKIDYFRTILIDKPSRP